METQKQTSKMEQVNNGIILTKKDIKQKPVNVYAELPIHQINKAEFIVYVENDEILILKSRTK